MLEKWVGVIMAGLMMERWTDLSGSVDEPAFYGFVGI